MSSFLSPLVVGLAFYLLWPISEAHRRDIQASTMRRKSCTPWSIPRCARPLFFDDEAATPTIRSSRLNCAVRISIDNRKTKTELKTHLPTHYHSFLYLFAIHIRCAVSLAMMVPVRDSPSRNLLTPFWLSGPPYLTGDSLTSSRRNFYDHEMTITTFRSTPKAYTLHCLFVLSFLVLNPVACLLTS